VPTPRRALPAAPPAPNRRSRGAKKPINLALQGGGAHGAFTWGVLDKLFEDDRVWIEALSGTSAGAMNAVVAAHGMYEGGAVGARRALHDFWKAVSDAGRASPIRRSAFARATGDWSLQRSPGFVFFDLLSRVVSPYEMNPFDVNPLRDLVACHVDFMKVRGSVDLGVFIAATNVETGRVRVFRREEIDLDVVMASACIPTLYKAVEIDDAPYWDGGFMGNPPLFPFFESCDSRDIVIVQINPVFRPGAPRTAREIQNRVNEITFNSALQHELRAINFVTRMLDAGHLDPGRYRKMLMHVIHARKRMRPLDATSKLNAEWSFLTHLRDIGRDTAERWLAANFDRLGVASSVDIRRMFDDRPAEDAGA